jgi:probable LLM family oxidoreductase
MVAQLELGVDTFGDVMNGSDGTPVSHAQALRNLVEEGIYADELGIDFIGVGEHHRPDFAVSAPEVVLAAIASRTKRIHLGSAVTVLSSDDPIRVFQRFSTLDAISSGRAEVILGRGSFTESFPLFGYDLSQYEVLFEEKLELFVELIRKEKINYSGPLRPPLKDQGVYPKLDRPELTTWIGVGGSPESVVRAARHNLPLMLAIIGGDPKRFVQYVDLYFRACKHLGTAPRPIGAHSPGHVGQTDEEARAAIYSDYKTMRDRIGGERGWPPMRESEFDEEISHGSLYVGSPETVAQKIAATARALKLSRFDLKYSAGGLSHESIMSCLDLYGTQVIPRVRELLG